MPRLTPIEKYLRKESEGPRAKYERRQAEKGLIRIAVFVPVSQQDEVKAECKRRVTEFLASRSDD